MVICASKFKWNDGFAVVNSSDIFGTWKYPHNFKVKSPRTGKIKSFAIDYEEAEHAEFWDGEFSIFRSEDKQQAIKIWPY